MAAEICPTVTARSQEEYREQMERVASFARRIHIDTADGIFTHVMLTPLDQIWWPANIRADVHVMHQDPFKHTKLLMKLQPQLIVVHAEADGDFVAFAETAHAHGIEVGVALKPETMPQMIEPALPWIDHVLIFSGNLGHFGGQANTHLLTKVLYLKQRKPSLEIGWDGGINNQNAHILAAGGVEVLNTGGFIQHAQDPEAAFRTLSQLVDQAPKPRLHSPQQRGLVQ